MSVHENSDKNKNKIHKSSLQKITTTFPDDRLLENQKNSDEKSNERNECL